jgi:hypothetical protein
MARLTKERKTLNSARGEEAVPDLVDAIMSNLRAVVDEYLAAFAYILPRAIGMVFVLVLGWLLGRLLGKAVAAVVKLSKADDALKGTPVGSYLAKAGYSLSTLMDLLTRIAVYLFSIAVAIRILRVPEAFALAQSLFDVVGRIVIGTAVFTVGLLIVEKVFDIAAKILVGEGGRTPLALSPRSRLPRSAGSCCSLLGRWSGFDASGALCVGVRAGSWNRPRSGHRRGSASGVQRGATGAREKP